MVQFHRAQHVLTLSGPLSMFEVVSAKACLGADLVADPCLEVDLSGLEDLDFAALQFLLWLKREGRRHGREIPFLRPGAAIRDALGQLDLLRALMDPHALPQSL